MLNIQYRMDPRISTLSNSLFYDSKVKDDESVVKRGPAFFEGSFLQPLTFFDLKSGIDFIRNKSRSNVGEAQACLGIVLALIEIGKTSQIPMQSKIGVITPYQEQLRTLQDEFTKSLGEKAMRVLDIEINTVDSFQGREKDLIVLSTVRAGDGRQGIGFLADVRRLNVAITRAKLGLFVVGQSSTLLTHKNWKALCELSDKNKATVTLNNPCSDILFRVLGLPERSRMSIITDVLSSMSMMQPTGDCINADKISEDPRRGNHSQQLQDGQAPPKEASACVQDIDDPYGICLSDYGLSYDDVKKMIEQKTSSKTTLGNVVKNEPEIGAHFNQNGGQNMNVKGQLNLSEHFPPQNLKNHAVQYSSTQSAQALPRSASNIMASCAGSRESTSRIHPSTSMPKAVNHAFHQPLADRERPTTNQVRIISGGTSSFSQEPSGSGPLPYMVHLPDRIVFGTSNAEQMSSTGGLDSHTTDEGLTAGMRPILYTTDLSQNLKGKHCQRSVQEMVSERQPPIPRQYPIIHARETLKTQMLPAKKSAPKCSRPSVKRSWEGSLGPKCSSATAMASAALTESGLTDEFGRSVVRRSNISGGNSAPAQGPPPPKHSGKSVSNEGSSDGTDVHKFTGAVSGGKMIKRQRWS